MGASARLPANVTIRPNAPGAIRRSVEEPDIARPTTHAQTRDGTVVAVFGRRFEVETAGGERLDCVTRGKKQIAVCGDEVSVSLTGAGSAVIEQLVPRRNYLERSDAFKRKGIAANVDQVLVLAAVEPRASEEFLTRILLIADAAGVTTLLALNKTDLPGVDAARARLTLLIGAGHELIEFSARPRDGMAASAPAVLRARLAGRRTLLCGQSGMGKSSLVNALVPDAAAVTGELSSALGSGRHTTTFSRLYRIDAHTTLIDCPGMQEVGIHHLSQADLARGFREFAPYLGRCRFSDCRHLHEPDCALREQVAKGGIAAERLALFQKLNAETGA
ncbi:MAG: ribosome small subunit-dependent GTPase A [Proteobacteria bacterium]|nr:ribosome small subunit-dependent GTPase A [Pseudomonadota bacterium]